jgi:hypothetical protein
MQFTMWGVGMRFSKRRLGVASVLVAQVLWGSEANAAGAMAVGIAQGGAQKGFAYGINSNSETEAAAKEKVLDLCKHAKNANDAARSRCKLVGTMKDQCGVIAMDPKNGTPGVGWAIAADLDEAKKQALANCEVTAGPGRAGQCKVDTTRCDGTADK